MSTPDSSSGSQTQVWPKDVGVLFRWPDVVDMFPGSQKDAARSFNALSRLVLFGGLSLFYVQRKPVFLAGTALLMLYLFGEQYKYDEEYYSMAKRDMQMENAVAPKPDPVKKSLQTEAAVAARRMLENPRDITARPALVPTTDDKIFASRPLPAGGDWSETTFPDWMAGGVGTLKTAMKPV
jgi:hypothetical protein